MSRTDLLCSKRLPPTHRSATISRQSGPPSPDPPQPSSVPNLVGHFQSRCMGFHFHPHGARTPSSLPAIVQSAKPLAVWSSAVLPLVRWRLPKELVLPNPSAQRCCALCLRSASEQKFPDRPLCA